MRTTELKQLLSEHKYIELRIGYASTYFVKNEYSLMNEKGNCAFVDEFCGYNTKYMPLEKAIASLVTRIRYAENKYDNDTSFYGPSPLNINVTIKNEDWVEEKSFTINLRGGE